MNEFKGTKGKWQKVTANWDLDQCVFIEDTEEKICDVKSLSHNAIYDALIISKTPEIFEKLKSLVSHYEDVLKGDFSPMALRSEIDSTKELMKEATELS